MAAHDRRRRHRDRDRLDEQGVLGRAADRLDPREPDARPAARAGARDGRRVEPGRRAAGRDRAARGPGRRPGPPARGAAQPPRRARGGPARDAARLALRLPPGGLSLWIELDAPRSSALAAVASQHGRAPGRRTALRRRRRLRALPAHPLHARGAGARRGGRAARRRLARRRRRRRAAGAPSRRRSSPSRAGACSNGSCISNTFSGSTSSAMPERSGNGLPV